LVHNTISEIQLYQQQRCNYSSHPSFLTNPHVLL